MMLLPLFSKFTPEGKELLSMTKTGKPEVALSMTVNSQPLAITLAAPVQELPNHLIWEWHTGTPRSLRSPGKQLGINYAVGIFPCQ
jgi:hypothetical protein